MTRVTPTHRRGFTILELMIALALLATLMMVAWSILGSYRVAEQRGWEQSYRMQVARVTRSWLASDAAHGLGADALERPLPRIDGSAPSASTLAIHGSAAPGSTAQQGPVFQGNERGFRWWQVPSVDPLPWLDQVTSGLEPLETTSQATDLAEAAPSALVDPVAMRTVVYSLVLEGTTSDELPVYQLLREVRAEDPWRDRTNEQEEEPEEVLTAEDLYRTTDEDIGAAATGDVLASDAVRHLVEPRFRYCDGRSWTTQWDSNLRGALPTAIELSFDHPPASSPYQVAVVEPAETTGDVPLEAPADVPADLSVATASAASGESEEVPERDVRIVVRIPGQLPSGAEDF